MRVSWTDVALAVSTALLTVGGLLGGLDAEPDAPRSAASWALPIVLGAALLVRRRWPREVLVVSIVALLVYYATGMPAVGLELLLSAAFFSAAEAGCLPFAAGAATALTVVSYGYRIADGQSLPRLLGFYLPTSVVIIGGAIAAGDAVRSRRAWRAEQEERERLVAERERERSQARIETERGLIARDVHDVVAHTVAVISLHADVAREAVGRDDAAVTRAIDAVRGAARGAIRELRQSVSVLRVGGDRPAPTLRDVDELVTPLAATGIDVRVALTVDDELPTAVDATGYRILQEALTNAVRHSAPTVIEVTGRRSGRGGYTLRVENDGAPAGPAASGGNGLRGMAERAALVGGAVRAAPDGAGGFVVEAELGVRT